MSDGVSLVVLDKLAWPVGLSPPSSHHQLQAICGEGTVCLLPSSRTFLSLGVALLTAGSLSVVELSPAGPGWLSCVVAVPVSSWPAGRHTPTT